MNNEETFPSTNEIDGDFEPLDAEDKAQREYECEDARAMVDDALRDYLQPKKP